MSGGVCVFSVQPDLWAPAAKLQAIYLYVWFGTAERRPQSFCGQKDFAHKNL